VTTVTAAQPDTEKMRFSVRTHEQAYGDGARFHEYRIVMRLGGRVVGIDDGPRRTHKSREDARQVGRARILELRQHQLYAIEVTKKDIEIGEARSCQSCAIAQALWRNQERMGLSKYEWDFRVEPYGFMVDVDGIVLSKLHDCHAPRLATGENAMPDLVSEGQRGIWVESMMEWSMNWDEWADSRVMSIEEWREEHGYHDGERPYRPSPCSFVLDMQALRETQ